MSVPGPGLCDEGVFRNLCRTNKRIKSTPLRARLSEPVEFFPSSPPQFAPKHAVMGSPAGTGERSGQCHSRTLLSSPRSAPLSAPLRSPATHPRSPCNHFFWMVLEAEAQGHGAAPSQGPVFTPSASWLCDSMDRAQGKGST